MVCSEVFRSPQPCSLQAWYQCEQAHACSRCQRSLVTPQTQPTLSHASPCIGLRQSPHPSNLQPMPLTASLILQTAATECLAPRTPVTARPCTKLHCDADYAYSLHRSSL
jgi:hypothetical protein